MGDAASPAARRTMAAVPRDRRAPDLGRSRHRAPGARGRAAADRPAAAHAPGPPAPPRRAAAPGGDQGHRRRARLARPSRPPRRPLAAQRRRAGPARSRPHGAGQAAAAHRLRRRSTRSRPASASTVGGATVTALPAVHDGRRRPLARARRDAGLRHRRRPARLLRGRHGAVRGDARAWPGASTSPCCRCGAGGHRSGPGTWTRSARRRPSRSCARAIAVPIHWGTFFPVGLEALRGSALVEPPRVFARHVAELAPEVEVRVLAPGDELVLGRVAIVSRPRRRRAPGASATAPSCCSRSRSPSSRLIAPDGSAARTIELFAAGATLLVAVLTSRAPAATRRAAGAVVAIVVVGGGIAAAVGGPASRH